MKPLPKLTGLGDLVEVATKATGIKQVVDKVSEVTGKDCGCSKRKAKLNQIVPFGKPEDRADPR